jgi:hypothetical protein
MMSKSGTHKMSLMLVLSILISTAVLPITSVSAAIEEKTILDISYGSIVIGSSSVSGYSSSETPVETANPDGYIITGSSTENTVTVTGGNHNIVLSDVSIDVTETANASAISIQSGGFVNITLSGVNNLSGGLNCAGLQVPAGAAVVIAGIGSLTANGNQYGAGIGGGRAQSGGSIMVLSGDITAIGGLRGAGIGGGGNINGSNGGDYNVGGNGGSGGAGGIITISGGTITASGGTWGAGIGGGGGGNGGTSRFRDGGRGGAGGLSGIITITGGIVAATGSGRGSGIGGGGAGDGGKSDFYNGGAGGAGGSNAGISITGGNISAVGDYSGAGIGSGGYGGGGSTSYGSPGARGSGGAIGTINIGNAVVNAQGGDYSAGIGGGAAGIGGEITIANSTVIAQSSVYGAGIGGGGANGSSGTIIIADSNINGQSLSGSGIGGGFGGSGGAISIYASIVNAQSQNSTGIGGNSAVGSSINIESSFITAISQSAAGIGGAGEIGKVIVITDSEVDARGGSNGAGIGGVANSSGGEITIANSTVIAQSSANGAGIGGGANGSGGTITINSGNVTAGSQYGAGIGGGSGSNGRNGDNMTSGGDGGGGSTGGAGGLITINGGIVSASSLIGAGIGGGAGGAGGKGGNGTSGGDGGRGGNGGTGGKIIINGGFVTVPGVSSISIDGGTGGSGGTGGMKTSGGIGGNGGNGGNGGEIIITGGTIAPSGIGNNNGIGGGNGGNGGNGGDAAAGIYERRPSGSAGAAAALTSCVFNGGSANARIGCTPTTGGDTPVSVYFTKVRLQDASEKSVNSLSLTQSGEINYGIKDIHTDADGKLYLYLPAFAGDTAALITAGGTDYSGYHGHISDTADFYNPNFLKMDQRIFSFNDNAERTFTFGDEIILDYAAGGGTLVGGSVTYSYAGEDFSTEETISDTPFLPSNAGSYLLKATLPGDDFYHDALAVKPFYITPKTIAGFSVSDIDPIIYTGEAGRPLAEVRDGIVDLVYGTDFTVECLDKNAGSATALIFGRGNYQGLLTREFQILPKSITINLSAAPAEATAGNTFTLNAAATGAVDIPDGTITFKYNNTAIAHEVAFAQIDSAYSAEAVWSNVPAGEYNITATYIAADNDNYFCTLNGQISDFNIIKNEQTDFRFSNGPDYTINEGVVNKTYGDELFYISVEGEQSTGEITYQVTEDSDVISINSVSGEVSILKAGTAVIMATSEADDYYNEASVQLTINVDKATPAVLKLPIAEPVSVKGTISSSKLSGGEASVPGNFIWTNPDQIVSESGTHEVAFIPDDAINYYTVIGEVSLQIINFLTDSNTGIQFDFSRTVLPDSANQVAVSVSAESANGSVFSIVKNLANENSDYKADVLSIYDFTMIDKNGELITEFAGTVTVKIPMQNGMSGDLRVMWYEPVTGRLTDMNARQEDGYLVFETTHFSYYAVMQMSEAESTPIAVPTTGESGLSSIYYVMLLLIGSAFLSRMILYFKRKTGSL